MYCWKCGAPNEDTAVNCAGCGVELKKAPDQAAIDAPAPQARQQAPIQVSNYLVQAILVTVFCCLPFGIVAIVYAAQVNGKIQMGDAQGALDYSRKARTWCWVSFGIGFGFTFLYFLLVIIGAVAGS